eukprot:2463653-Amphidinium_carterae.2
MHNRSPRHLENQRFPGFLCRLAYGGLARRLLSKSAANPTCLGACQYTCHPKFCMAESNHIIPDMILVATKNRWPSQETART